MQRVKPLVDAINDAFYIKPGDGGRSVVEWMKILAKRHISPTTTVHDVEEIIGQSLVKIARMAQSNKPAFDIANEFSTVLRTTARDYYARNKRVVVNLPNQEPESKVLDPAEELGARESVREVIRGLTERDRTLLKKRIDGWSYEQIAAFFETTSDSRPTVDALTVAVSRILRSLRDAAKRG
jgi:DNA-directed RNA polymerase specialized sigma24 family protein